LAVSGSFVALAFGLVAAVAPAGAEVAPPGAPQFGKIYSLASSPANCMDVSGGNTFDGTPVLAYTCHNADNQQWTYRLGSNTILASGGANLGACLDVGGDHVSNGSPVQIWGCNGTGAQVWRIVGQSLYNPQSGRCLDDPSGQIHQLQIWDCNFGGNANQNWDIVGYTS
jgi:hypothetical protein